MRFLAIPLAAILLVIAVVLMVHTGSEPVPFDYDRTPVVLVHGHGLSPEYWDDLTASLLDSGYPQEYVLAVDIRPRRMSNPVAAKKFIQPAVDRLIEDANAAAVAAGYPTRGIDKVDIVAHSMGAVSSRWYAAKIAPEKVRTWISLAGANYGTNALCSHEDDGARELCPAFATSLEESAVQIELNGSPGAPKDATPYGIGEDSERITTVSSDDQRSILYYTLRQSDDKWIIPASSAEIDGAGGIVPDIIADLAVIETASGNFLLQEPSDHDNLPRNPIVIRAVAALLAARDEVRQSNR